MPQDVCGWQSSQGSCGVLPALPGQGGKGDISWEGGREGEREQHLLSASSYTLYPDRMEYLTGEVLEASGLKAMGIKMRGKRLAFGSVRCPEEGRGGST